MDYSKLGSSGIEVSRVCLGTMTWGKQNTEAEGHEQMDYALTHGVNFFDTAEMYAVPPDASTYGKTEQIIGTWFKKNNTRDRVVLASKIAGPGNDYVRGGKNRIDGANVTAAIESSLKRLQTDYIDLYQLHWPNRPFPHFGKNNAGEVDFTIPKTEKEVDMFLGVLQALDAAKKAGKIRHVGLSNDTPWGVMKYLELAKIHNLPRMTSIQVEFNLLKRSDDPYLVEACVREDVAYLPWSPLGGGQISGKYLDGKRPKGTRWAVDMRPPFRDTPDANEAIRKYMAIASKHAMDVTEMALKFCDQQNFVTSTIIGATSMEQLKSNINAFDLTLSPEVLKEIDAVYRQYPLPY